MTYSTIYRIIERFDGGYKYCYTYCSKNPAVVGIWFNSKGQRTIPPCGFVEGILEGREIRLSDVQNDPYFKGIIYDRSNCYKGGNSPEYLELLSTLSQSQANRRDERLGEPVLSRVLAGQDWSEAKRSGLQAPPLEDLVRDSRKTGSPADANAMSDRRVQGVPH